MSAFFDKNASQTYDEKNSRLAPIAEAMHFLTGMVLNALPVRAHILCVGVGTGAEILSLAAAHPEWTFVGVDPSGAMLEVCRARLQNAGVLERCALIEGYVQDAPAGESFDAALSILVGHFVPRDQRQSFYSGMQQRLKPGGYLVNAEISFDLDGADFPSMLKNWESLQAKMGATPESLQSLGQVLRSKLHVLAPSETESLLRTSGIGLPVRFFQAFMITGWYGQKSPA